MNVEVVLQKTNTAATLIFPEDYVHTGSSKISALIAQGQVMYFQHIINQSSSKGKSSGIQQGALELRKKFAKSVDNNGWGGSSAEVSKAADRDKTQLITVIENINIEGTTINELSQFIYGSSPGNALFEFKYIDEEGNPKPFKDSPIISTKVNAKLISRGNMGAENVRRANHWKRSHNIILEGPPGTGKTWSAKDLADKLAGENLFAEPRGANAISLHPSTSYEDFIEGLRPTSGDEKGRCHKDLKFTLPLPHSQHSVDGKQEEHAITIERSSTYTAYSAKQEDAALYGISYSNVDELVSSKEYWFDYFEENGCWESTILLASNAEVGNTNQWKFNIQSCVRPSARTTNEDILPTIIGLRNTTDCSVVDATDEGIGANNQWTINLPASKRVNAIEKTGPEGRNQHFISVRIFSDRGTYTLQVNSDTETEDIYQQYENMQGQMKDFPKNDVEAQKNFEGILAILGARAWIILKHLGRHGPLNNTLISNEKKVAIYSPQSDDANAKLWLIDHDCDELDLIKEAFPEFDVYRLNTYTILSQMIPPENATFSVEDGFFLRNCLTAFDNPNNDHVVLLDEINRCNVPKVLGDLLTLIESGKRIPHEERLGWDFSAGATTVLPYSKRIFGVPDNLYVMGTMNTTDRSVAPLDAALRRRFTFMRLPPMKKSVLKSKVKNELHLHVDIWEAINKQLKKELGEDAQLGHSYFFDVDDGIGNDEDEEVLSNLWGYSLLPQIADLLDATGDAQQVWENICGVENETIDIKEKLFRIGWKISTPEIAKMSSQVFSRTIVESTGEAKCSGCGTAGPFDGTGLEHTDECIFKDVVDEDVDTELDLENITDQAIIENLLAEEGEQPKKRRKAKRKGEKDGNTPP
jgi:hypothetical protein